MSSYHLILCNGVFVCQNNYVGIILSRQIQDPASQRLTWYKTPLAVLVIKKARDHTVLPPFIKLVEWLMHVSRI